MQFLFFEKFNFFESRFRFFRLFVAGKHLLIGENLFQNTLNFCKRKLIFLFNLNKRFHTKCSLSVSMDVANRLLWFKFCAIQSNMSCLISKVQNNNNQAYQHQIDSAQERAWENVPKQLMRDLAPKRPWVCFALYETI